jgi:hypothetical protein
MLMNLLVAMTMRLWSAILKHNNSYSEARFNPIMTVRHATDHSEVPLLTEITLLIELGLL